MHIIGRTNRTYQPGRTNTRHRTAWTTRIHIGNKTHRKAESIEGIEQVPLMQHIEEV